MSQHPDDIDVDRRLRLALAHAPDAQAQPPSALDDTILRAAHAELRSTAPQKPTAWAGFLGRLRHWWRHPATAPIIAVFALSTVIVSMWNRHEIPPLRDEAPQVSQAPAPTQPVAPGQDRSGKQSEMSAAPHTATAEGGASPAAAKAPSHTDVLAREATATANRQPALSPQRAAERRPTATELAKHGVAPAAAPTPTAAPTAAPRAAAARGRQEAANTTAPPGGALGRAAAERNPGAEAAPDMASAVVPRTAADSALVSSPAAPSAVADRQAATASPPLSLALGNAALRWRAGPLQAPVAIDERGRQWLLRLAAATSARWRTDVDTASATGTHTTTHAPALAGSRNELSTDGVLVMELWSNNEPWATIAVGATDVTWTEATGRRWRASVSGEVAQALRTP